MGKAPSATTLSSIAYLTETGRRYLFGKDGNGNPIRFEEDGTDNFEIVEFALFDSDRNYNVVNNLESGDMPDIAGTSDNTCLKTSADIQRRNRIAFEGLIPNIGTSNTTIQYVSSTDNIIVDVEEL